MSGAPFIHHPLAVAALVLRFGGDAEQAQAALLHDALGSEGATEGELRARFGDEVTRLVLSFVEESAPKGVWSEGKKLYLSKLRELDEKALLVVVCEELHELGSLTSGLRYQGVEAWKRYPAHGMEVFWYFREIYQLCVSKLRAPQHRALVGELGTLVRALQAVTLDGAQF